eukprot:CAMPEP_0204898926 /NCGR_PEP_ID=MMETSP1397-20131031/1557_1 /ASSEMBLY_ACC=CAM_ASM_000891 /TAXON_ID=49980 /ORGANISM="Climacostomum Climacostomum virens, Strain Stock W-24" /LENGTH=243 /DNA_ID=CAMNT_0052066817 /DNA_START=2917 /DNA_END=3648 /DNA_ORIENTATION=+
MEGQLVTIPEPTSLSAEQQAAIARKNRVFQELVADFPVSLGKEVSKDERDTMSCEDHTLTYGELDFISFAETFEVIKRECGQLKPGGLFVDLGSGTGKGVIAGALLNDFAECWGIELLNGLFTISEQLKETYDREFPRLISAEPDLFLAKPLVRMINGSFFDIDWSNASFIFANSTCFSREMMKKLGEVEVQPGTIAITLTKTLHSPLWKVVDSFKKRMSWGDATVFIQQRLADCFNDEEEAQ